jgi:hypothetical protein
MAHMVIVYLLSGFMMVHIAFINPFGIEANIILFIIAIIAGVIFGFIFRILSERTLLKLKLFHSLLLSILFVITGSLALYFPIYFLEAIMFVPSAGTGILPHYPQISFSYIMLLYSIFFILVFNLRKTKQSLC